MRASELSFMLRAGTVAFGCNAFDVSVLWWCGPTLATIVRDGATNHAIHGRTVSGFYKWPINRPSLVMANVTPWRSLLHTSFSNYRPATLALVIDPISRARICCFDFCFPLLWRCCVAVYFRRRPDPHCVTNRCTTSTQKQLHKWLPFRSCRVTVTVTPWRSLLKTDLTNYRPATLDLVTEPIGRARICCFDFCFPLLW